MSLLLEYYKNNQANSAIQYYCNFSSIPSNLSQYYSHFGTNRRGNTLLLRPTCANLHHHNHHNKCYARLEIVLGAGFTLLKAEQLQLMKTQDTLIEQSLQKFKS